MASREEMMRRFRDSKNACETTSQEPAVNGDECASDTKVCPYCGETIKAVAIKCRFCGEWLEKKEEKTESAEVLIENEEVVTENQEVVRYGDSSEVEFTNPSFTYEGDNSVVFKIDRLDNISGWSTGDLKICCWASRYRFDFEHEFCGDSYILLDECYLGHLQQGYGFPNVNCTFNFNKDDFKNLRWRFVFTVNELSSDKEWNIVNYANTDLMGLQDSDYGLILDIIEDKLGCERDEIEYDSRFKDDLGADSLDSVELIMEFENAFDITVPDDEASKIVTVGDVIEYIKSVL